MINKSITSAAGGTAVITITGVTGLTIKVYSVDAWTSAGNSQLTITDGGVTTWQSPSNWIGTILTTRTWTPQPFQSNTAGNNIVLTASSSGGGNTVTLSVQADNV